MIKGTEKSFSKPVETVWLSLGSNLGNRNGNIVRAVEAMASFLGEMTKAPTYETIPQDFHDQGMFLNSVVRGRTDLSPRELLNRILNIEIEIGRVRDGEHPKGPRVIDVDILLFGNRVVDEHGLTIPHNSMARRLFVLRPLLDIDPDLTDPRDSRPWSERLPHLAGQGVFLYTGVDGVH